MRFLVLFTLLFFLLRLPAQHYYLISASAKQKYKIGTSDRISFVLKKDTAHFSEMLEKKRSRKDRSYPVIQYMNDTCFVLKTNPHTATQAIPDTIRWDEVSQLKIHKPYIRGCRIIHSWMYMAEVISVTSPLLLLAVGVPLSPGFFVVYLLQAPVYIVCERVLQHYLNYQYYFNLQQWKISESKK